MTNRDIYDLLIQGASPHLEANKLPSFPESYWAIMRSCWVVDPDKRPNINEVIEKLPPVKDNEHHYRLQRDSSDEISYKVPQSPKLRISLDAYEVEE
jgi:hypothetical protein